MDDRKEEKTEHDESDDQVNDAENHEDRYEDEYLEDTVNVRKKKKKYVLMAILLGIVAAAGFFSWFMNNRDWKFSDSPSPDQQVEQTVSSEVSEAVDASISSQKAAQPETTERTAIPERTSFGLGDRLEKATRLRNELLNKQENIRALKYYYRNRIKDVTDEILSEKREKGIATYQQAIKSKRIELGLRTIRRRRLYINKLDRPLEQLHSGSEVLLYMRRLAEIQIQMAPVVNGIDMAELGRQMNTTIEEETGGVNSLAIDTKETISPSLEEIWKEIIHGTNMKEKLGKKGQNGGNLKKKKVHFKQQEKLNNEIWQELCTGNPSRKHELTRLSLNAAKCLSQWEGQNLFLNGITELPAPIARQLSQWKGEWLCLNGLTELSPETAEGLSRWKGVRLSLNRIMELTPQAAKHLSQWQGKQIEVVGLTKISSEADSYLSVWEKAGGEIYMRN